MIELPLICCWIDNIDFCHFKRFLGKEAISCMVFIDLIIFGIMAGIYYDKVITMILGLYIIGEF